MDYSSQEKIPTAPSDQSANMSLQDQPPAYSSLLAPTQPIITTQPTQPTNVVYVISQPQVGPDPTTMTCPHCQAVITTIVHQETSAKTHLMCLLLCLLGCWCCVPLVYCTDGCLSKRHSCPNCNKFLGVYDA